MSKGYITLVSVMVVGAVAVATIVSIILLGIGSSRTSFAHVQSNQSKALVSACAEEGLQQIRNQTNFAGTGGLSLGEGSCSYSVSNQGGQNRLILASSTVGTTVRKIKIVINKINPTIQLTSWQEVADF